MEEKRKEREESRSNLSDFTKPLKRELRFFTDDGRPLNINQEQMKFSLTEDDELETYILDVACYKHIGMRISGQATEILNLYSYYSRRDLKKFIHYLHHCERDNESKSFLKIHRPEVDRIRIISIAIIME